MTSTNSKIYKAIFAAAFLFASAIFSFGQELAPLEFVGASDENPDVQTVTLQQVGADARIEVSDERLIRAELATEGETSRLTVAVNTVGQEATEEGREYEGSVRVIDATHSYFIPIKWIVFLFTPKECRGKRTTVQYLSRGTADNFWGVESTFPSPFQSATYTLQRQYDHLLPNQRYFGDSYRLGGCRVCAVRVYVRARGEGEIDDNDSLWFTVSDAANGTNYNPVNIVPGFNDIWTYYPSPYTFYREIPGSVINPEIWNKNAATLDISSQDDTAIDYTRVYIYRY